MFKQTSQASQSSGTSRAIGLDTLIMVQRGNAGGSASVALVNRDIAADLLGNFFSALEAPAAAQRSLLDYARVQASRQLKAWGVPRQPFPAQAKRKPSQFQFVQEVRNLRAEEARLARAMGDKPEMHPLFGTIVLAGLFGALGLIVTGVAALAGYFS